VKAVSFEITSSDRLAIIELARRMGIDHVESISVETIEFPNGCSAAVLQSAVAVDGNRRRYDVLVVRRNDWPRCRSTRPGAERAIKRWRASQTGLHHIEEWQIADGNWHGNAILNSGVSYAAADSAILAIHRKEVTQRYRSQTGGADASEISNGESVRIIRKGEHYEVGIGTAAGGDIFIVVPTVNGRFELDECRSWIS
jgi:hypothetical protein